MPLRKKAASDAPPKTLGKAATINDIARLSGVSKKTVSRIINNSPLVRKDTRDKVEALMREVGYAPDPLARGLAFRRSFLIGMVYDNPTAQYLVDMQYGALDALRGSSFELVVHPCDTRSPGYIEGVKRFVQQQKLHGVILVPRASEDQALADMLDEIGCRFTRIAALPLDETSQMGITHDRDGAAEAADYLLSLGHRDIAFIKGHPNQVASAERYRGFVAAIEGAVAAATDRRSKAAAEEAVREAIPSAVILRPSIVFGPEDKFFNRLWMRTTPATAIRKRGSLPPWNCPSGLLQHLSRRRRAHYLLDR